ncbi:MAG: metal ABC transporter permease [Alphaproteobacteria bacterium]|nr:metal ABC transporter permease [Alphaproteobacteria bacterium]
MTVSIILLVSTIMLDHFILFSLVAAVCLSFSLAPLGCFLLWRRQAFFGDAMAHSAMLGVAVSLMWSVTPLWGILLICTILSALLAYGPLIFKLPSDAWLGLLSYTLMAIAFIVMRSLPRGGAKGGASVEQFLFGDLLLLNISDIIVLVGITLVVVAFLFLFWRKLILITLDSDWASVEGIAPHHMTFVFLLMLSCVVAATLPIVGALLVPGLMLLPGASAAQFSRSPEGMIRRAIFMALLMLIGGISLGFHMDWPVGPASIVVGFGLFLGGRIVPRAFRR